MFSQTNLQMGGVKKHMTSGTNKPVGDGQWLDLTFITNEPGKTLKDRFLQLIKDCKFFDVLTAYFYISGFHLLYKALEETERIRILIGIGTSRETYELIKSERDASELLLPFSALETKQKVEEAIEDELSNSEDSLDIEEGIKKFVEWVKSGKIEIRAYPSRNLHAKLYIMTFKEGDRDIGRVITGSSNFTYSGLVDNLEFNVELKNRSDYEFAKERFEELWKNSVDVSEKVVQTIKERTWLNETIMPYELYLKFLYEYFKEELERSDELFTKYVPEDFKRLSYQEQAVLNAKRILDEYGGVFISDVVGLGKTYITALLVSQLDGRTLVIAPPALLDRNNPGSWTNVFYDFHIPANFISIGRLDEAREEINRREYKNIVIDESHRFRNESTMSYEIISEICRGKRVILVSATPYNNSPQDILSQIKLFQNARKSHIPGIPNIEEFMKKLDKKLKSVDRQNNYDEYLRLTKEIAKEIREKVLKYIMVRRTRSEIEKYFSEDLKRNNIRFPKVEDPKPLYYQFNDKEDEIFMKTVKLLTRDFKYARYTPLLYLSKGISPLEEQSQKNLGGFMKVLLVKRLESSFYAFRKSIDRFIRSYELFIKEYENGNVYVSKQHINKVFELLEEGNDEEIQRLIDEGKVERFNSNDFRSDFEKDLKKDLEILRTIKSMWEEIQRDPKLETLLYNLRKHPVLKNNKVIIFTESKETAEYLVESINREFGEIALCFHGGSTEAVRDKVIENFDARARNKRDDYRILVSTDALSEGVNLHRSNVVINYDIPWNPTRMMQRVGRVNRIGTQFDRIYTFNFFPAKQTDDEIELTNIARSKIEAFLTMLGGDSAILTEGEPVASHELFDKLLSHKTIVGDEEGESELKYFRVIEDIRNNNPELFERIKRLPKKARSAKIFDKSLASIASPGSLLTFFRKGRLMKFFLSDKDNTIELDFLTSAKILESSIDERRGRLPVEEYYELLYRNKIAFLNSTIEETIDSHRRGASDSSTKLLKILKATQKNSQQLTEEQEEYLRKVIIRIEEGAIPKKTLQKTLNALDKLGKEIMNPLKVVATLQREIPPTFLKAHYVDSSAIIEGRREVILSLYLTEEGYG